MRRSFPHCPRPHPRPRPLVKDLGSTIQRDGLRPRPETGGSWQSSAVGHHSYPPDSYSPKYQPAPLLGLYWTPPPPATPCYLPFMTLTCKQVAPICPP